MPTKKEQEQKIRELEEKIRRMEEQLERSSSGGVAGGTLRGLADIIPGLGKMLEGLDGSEAFQERLETINKEVEKKLREASSARIDVGGVGIGIGGGKGGIPARGSIPKVERGFSIGSLADDKPAFEVKGGKPRSKRQRAAEPQPTKEREVLVDIFEEDKHLKIVVELPGVEEGDIKVELKGESLFISADTPYRKYYKEVALPCPVKGKPGVSYRNGILEVALEKEAEDAD
jgi:HSP20 family protein